MSGLEDTAVVGCVAAVVSAYQDATELLRDIEHRNLANSATQDSHIDDRVREDLALSILRGQEAIKVQYERDFKKLGSAFSAGDQIARETLKEIVVRMQKSVITPLKVAWLNKTPVDYFALLSVSDESQDRAIMVLMQLCQRLLVAAPIDVISGAGRRRGDSSGKIKGYSSNYTHHPRRQSPPEDLYRYGNHVEISAGVNSKEQGHVLSTNTYMKLTPPPEADTRPAQYAPHQQRYDRYYDSRRAEHFYNPDAQNEFKEPSERSSYGGSESDRDSRLRFAPSQSRNMPAMRLPIRGSGVSSISSMSSSIREHSENNPWVAGADGISPLSSLADEIAAGNPFRNPLVPDALSPRRSQENGLGLHPRITPATLHVPSENVLRDETMERSISNGKSHKMEPTDEQSVVSETSSIQPSYYGAPSPNDFARQHNILASQSPSSDDIWTRHPSARSQDKHTRIPRPMSPQEIYGPPPTAAPDRPIPRPGPPRIPERAPNRPRGASNASRSTADSSNSPIESTTPLTPFTPRSIPLPYGEDSLNSVAYPNTFKPPYSNSPPIQSPIITTAHRPDAHESQYNHPTSSTAISTTGSHYAPSTTAVPPLQGPQRMGSMHTTRTTSSSASNPSTLPDAVILRTVPSALTSSAAPAFSKPHLPAEANGYGGLCKGAWRAQIGDSKKTWEERSRPGGMYGPMHMYVKCTKCQFEGRLGPRETSGNAAADKKRRKSESRPPPDRKVYGAEGIKYRWEFLFKSHVTQGKHALPAVESEYGCVFCAAEGRGTPVFAGVAGLLAHLREHRIPGHGTEPRGEIVYRMNAIIGREPVEGEEWDLVLPYLG